MHAEGLHWSICLPTLVLIAQVVFLLECGHTDTQVTDATVTLSTILRPSWILSKTTRVSWHQKGKSNLDLLEQKIVSRLVTLQS